MIYNSLTIDWSSFSQEITDKDGSNARTITWNVPHAVYKSDTPLDLDDIPNPHAVLSEDEFTYTDNELHFDIKYYYRLSELRPGGEFFTEQVTIEIKHHILKFEAPFLAQIEYGNARTDNAGNIVPYTRLNLSKVDDDGERVEVLKPEWFWDGNGRISEWVEIIVNDEPIEIRERGNFTNNIKNIVTNKDRRNYPAGKIDGVTPVTSRAFYLGRNNIVQAPYWWAEWHRDVRENNPSTWHSFWMNRFNEWDDTQDWYNEDWTTDERTILYENRPHNRMYGPYSVERYQHSITDLILRARIGTTLSNGVYTGNKFVTNPNNPDERIWVNGVYDAIPRPGNSIGVGLGATLTFRQIRQGMTPESKLSFVFEGTHYEIVLEEIRDISVNNINLLTSKLFEIINNEVGMLDEDAPEPNISVSFGPRFDNL